jgi:chromosome partitioning protein
LLIKEELENNNIRKPSRFLRCFREVLLIDADPQANASSGLGIDVDILKLNIPNSGAQQHPREAIIKCSAPNVDIIPSHIDLVA